MIAYDLDGLCVDCVFFFQAEDGIRDAQESRGLGDVYKRQAIHGDCVEALKGIPDQSIGYSVFSPPFASLYTYSCLLYTSDAADDLLCVDLGGRRIIKKKNTSN